MSEMYWDMAEMALANRFLGTIDAEDLCIEEPQASRWRAIQANPIYREVLQELYDDPAAILQLIADEVERRLQRRSLSQGS